MTENALTRLESGSSQDMAVRLDDMTNKLDLMQKFFSKVMKKDVDYGVIQGTQKPSLLKPGAEKLCELYNYAITIAEKDEEKDLSSGYYRARLVVRLVSRSNGNVVAEGVGEANTYESRYRYRWVSERDLPKGLDKDSLTFKEKTGQYGNYNLYRVENDDLFSLWNTVLKMAKKRALVDAALSATRSSGLFTQAEDELDAWIEGETDEPPGGEPGKQPDLKKGQQGTQRPGQQPPRGNSGQQAGRRSGPANPNAPASEPQKKAIFGAAKGKGLTGDEVKDLVFNQTGKDVDQLNMGEASNMIEMINNTDKQELKALAVFDPGTGEDEPPSWLGGDEQ